MNLPLHLVGTRPYQVQGFKARIVSGKSHPAPLPSAFAALRRDQTKPRRSRRRRRALGEGESRSTLVPLAILWGCGTNRAGSIGVHP
jgi:hypothetical protein